MNITSSKYLLGHILRLQLKMQNVYTLHSESMFKCVFCRIAMTGWVILEYAACELQQNNFWFCSVSLESVCANPEFAHQIQLLIIAYWILIF